jgi:hypothetical protein
MWTVDRQGTLSAEARGRLKSDVGEIRHICLDFDQNGRDALKALRSRDDTPGANHVITSSPGRYQVVWRVPAAEPPFNR